MKKALIIISILILTGCGIFFYLVIYPKMNEKSDHSEEQFPAIKIGLVNGCGYQGVASNIAESMTDKNIEVVQISNARKFIYKESVIVVKVNDKNELERLKKMTGIKNVIYALNDSYPVPFLIIAGKDYQTYFY